MKLPKECGGCRYAAVEVGIPHCFPKINPVTGEVISVLCAEMIDSGLCQVMSVRDIQDIEEKSLEDTR